MIRKGSKTVAIGNLTRGRWVRLVRGVSPYWQGRTGYVQGFRFNDYVRVAVSHSPEPYDPWAANRIFTVNVAQVELSGDQYGNATVQESAAQYKREGIL